MTPNVTWRRTCCVLVLALAAAPAARGQQAPAQGQPATLVVRLRSGAKLTVDGHPTKQTGEVRSFYSPPLEPGKSYTYVLVAVWEPNNYTTITRTRTVHVYAGKETKVDMTKADPKEPDNIVIRWVPTPEKVVDRMLELAKVGKDDVVWDLGCGDGIIVTRAVSKFKAKHAVGIDLDPKRIKEAKARAAKEGVEDKVDIRQGNVLKITDFSPATVVTLYMSDALNEAVRPMLQKTLKPGSRIVSHRFLMGDWKPDKTVTVTVKDPDTLKDEEYKVHLWTVPRK